MAVGSYRPIDYHSLLPWGSERHVHLGRKNSVAGVMK